MSAELESSSWSILLIYNLVVFMGAATGGFLPLLIHNCIHSAKLMNLISIFGAGIMLGVGLIIIIPEGTSLVFKSYQPHIGEQAQIICGLAITVGFIFMMTIDEIFGSYAHYKAKKVEKKYNRLLEFHSDLKKPLVERSARPLSFTETDFRLKNQECPCQNDTQLSPPTPQFFHSRKKEKRLVAIQITTLGLAIHCLADGLALGISQISGASTGALVFLAVILHKIPAFFGYSVFLSHEGTTRCRTCALVILISMISPLMSILAYFSAVTVLDRSSASQKSRIAGALLVVSAGTFLYAVTMHILPQVYVRKNDAHSKQAAKTEAKEHYPKIFQMCVLFGGIIGPLSLKCI